MVRETRYLWVANLPENVNEERISEHFKRYGKIQSVKFRTDNDVTLGALVAFTDIKSAEKAQNGENVLEGNVLRTEYSEPGASILSLRNATPAPAPEPTSNDVGNTTPRNSFIRAGFARPSGEDKPEEKKEVERGRPRERYLGVNHPAVPIAGESLKTRPQYRHDKGRKANGPGPGYSRSPSTESSTGSRSSSSSSDRSRSISSKSQSGKSRKSGSMLQRTGSEDGHLGIFITGLPLRSSDSSLRDGLFHEYKKYGKVVAVSVQGQQTDRFAIVTFKKSDDAGKALEGSQGRRFFGAKIVVTEHEGIEPEDSEYRPPEAELDEYHPKATRTLFVGNLEKDISAQDLKDIFSEYGEIIDVDIKKQAQGASYAFVQFTDINSVVRALRKMDGENVGANKVKLGFGKSMPTNCIWIDNVTDAITEKSLCRQFSRHGIVQSCHIDRELKRALLYYDSTEIAQYTTADVRGRLMGGRKLQVDFASRDCQLNFFEKMERTHQLRPGDYPDERLMMRSARPQQNFPDEERYDNRRRFENRPGFQSGGSGYRPAPGTANFRSTESGTRSYRQTGNATSSGRNFRDASEEYPERRRRHADEYSQTSFSNDDYEAELREYSQRSRRDPYDSQSPFDSRDSSPTVRRVASSSYDRYDYYDRYEDDPRYRGTGTGAATDATKTRKNKAGKDRTFSPTNSDYSQSTSHGYRSRSDSPERRKRTRTPIPTSPGHDDFIQPNEDELLKKKRKKRTANTTSDSGSDLEYEVRCSERGTVKKLREEAGYRSGASDPEAIKRKLNSSSASRRDSDSDDLAEYDATNLQKQKRELQQKLKQLDDNRIESDGESGSRLDVSLGCRKQMEARRAEESRPAPSSDRTAPRATPMDDSELGPDSLNDVPPEFVGPNKRKSDKKKRPKDLFKPPENLDARPDKPKREPMDLPLPKFAYEIGFSSPKPLASPRPHTSPKGVTSPQISPSIKPPLAVASPPFSPPIQKLSPVKPEEIKPEGKDRESIGSPLLSDTSLSPGHSPPLSPAHMSLEDRIRALDEKISKAESVRPSAQDGASTVPGTGTGNHALSTVNGTASTSVSSVTGGLVGGTTPLVDYHSKYRVKKKADNNKSNGGEKDNMDTVTSRILARTSVFDLDAQRLEQKLDDSLPVLALNEDVAMVTDLSDVSKETVAMDTTSSLASASVTLPSASVLSSVTEALLSDTSAPALPFTTPTVTSALTVDTETAPVTSTVTTTMDTSSNSNSALSTVTSPKMVPAPAPVPPVGILKKTSPPRPGILKKPSTELCNGPLRDTLESHVKSEASLDDDTPDLSPVVENATSWRSQNKEVPSMPVLKPETDIFPSKPEIKTEPDVPVAMVTDPPLLMNSKRKCESSVDAPNAKIPKLESKSPKVDKEHKDKNSKDSKPVKTDVKKEKSSDGSKDNKHVTSSKDVKPSSKSDSKHTKNVKDKSEKPLSDKPVSDKSKSVTSDKPSDKVSDKNRDSSKTHKSEKDRTRSSDSKSESKDPKKTDKTSSDNSNKSVIKKEISVDRSDKPSSSDKKKSDKSDVHKDKSTDKIKSSSSSDKSVKKDVKSESKDKKSDVKTDKDVKKDKSSSVVKKEDLKKEKKDKKDEDRASSKEKDVKKDSKDKDKDKKSDKDKSKSDKSKSDKEPKDKDGKGPNGSSKGNGGSSHGSGSGDKGSGSGSSDRNHDNNNGKPSNSGSSGGGNGNHGNNGNGNGNGNHGHDEQGNQANKESGKKSQDKKDKGNSNQQQQKHKSAQKKERVPAAFRELKELGIDFGGALGGFSSMYDNIKRRSSKPAKPEEKSASLGAKKRRPSYLDSEGTPDSSDNESDEVFSELRKKQNKKKSPSKTHAHKKNHVMLDSSTSSDDDDEALLKKPQNRKPAKKSTADVYTSSDSDARPAKKSKPKITPKKETKKKPKDNKKSKNRGIYTSSDSDSEPKKPVKKKKYENDKKVKPLTNKGKGLLNELYNEISSSESSDEDMREMKKEKNNFDFDLKKKPEQHKLTSKEEEDLKKNNIVFDKISSQIKALSDDHNKINERKIHELKSDLDLLKQRRKSNELARERSDKSKFDKNYDTCIKAVLDLQMQALHDISRSNSKYLDKSNMITKDSMYNRDLPLSLTETKNEPKLNSFDIHRVHDEQARKKHKAKQRLKQENALLDVKDLNRINYEKKHHEFKQQKNQNDVIKLNDVAYNKPIMFNHVNHNDAYFDDVHIPIENEVDNVAEEQTVETMYEAEPRDYKFADDIKREDSDSEPLPELIIEEEPRKDTKSEEHEQPELELKRSAEETSQAAKMLEEVCMNEESWNCSSGLVIEEAETDEQPVTGQDELEAAIASLAGEEEEEYPVVPEVPPSDIEKDKSFDRSFSEVEEATKSVDVSETEPVQPEVEKTSVDVKEEVEDVKNSSEVEEPVKEPKVEVKTEVVAEEEKPEEVAPVTSTVVPEVPKPASPLPAVPESVPEPTVESEIPVESTAPSEASKPEPEVKQEDVPAVVAEPTPEVTTETPHTSKHKKKKHHHHHHKKRQRRDSRRSTDQELETPHLDSALVIADDKIQVEPPLAPLEHLQSMSAELFKPREEAPSISTETDSKPDHVTSSGDDTKPSLSSPGHMNTAVDHQDLVPPLVISTDKTPKRRPRRTKKPPKEPMSDISVTIDGVLNDYEEERAESAERENQEPRSEGKMSESSCDSTETSTSPRRKSPARTPGMVSDIKTRLRPENKRRKPRRSLYMDENDNKDKLVAPPAPEVQPLSEKEREKKLSEYDFHDEFDEDVPKWRHRDDKEEKDAEAEGKDEGQLVIDEGDDDEKVKKKKTKRRESSPRAEKDSPVQETEEERPPLVTVLQLPYEAKKKRAKRRKEHGDKEEHEEPEEVKESTEKLQDEVIAMAERAAADANEDADKDKKKQRTKSSDGNMSDFLSNIDKIIAEVADGNFDINSIQDDPNAPPRRRGSRSNSKIHEERPPSRDTHTPTDRARKTSQSEGTDTMPPPQFTPYHQDRFYNRPGSPDKTSPITPATPLFDQKSRIATKSPPDHYDRSSPTTSTTAKYYPPPDGLVMVARDDRHDLKYSSSDRAFFPPERHVDRKEHSSKSPSGKISPRSQNVHMGVVQGAPFTIAQREALERSGQMIERVPNPNLPLMTDTLVTPSGEKLSPSEVAKLHSPKLSAPPQVITSDMGVKPTTPLASPNHPQMIQQKGPPGPPGAPGPPGPSELRAMLSQPNHRITAAGLRPPSNPSEMQLSPGLRIHTDPRRDTKHDLPHLETKIPEAYLRGLPPGDPRHEQFYHPDFLQHGIMYAPGIPVLDPRLMFQPQRPEFIAQQSPHLPIGIVHPQQFPPGHGRLTPESRPPSRPLSAHGQHGLPLPAPGVPFFQVNAVPDAPAPTEHLLRKYPVMWQGCLALKNDSANVQMHFVSGGQDLVRLSLPDGPVQDGNLNTLRIAQRMRLEAQQLDAVAKRMEDKATYCMLLALPCGRDDGDLLVQTQQLKTGFIHYLQHKQAAGIVNTPAPGTQQTAYVVHIFPPCEFSKTTLARTAPDLLRSCLEIAHVLIVIATV